MTDTGGATTPPTPPGWYPDPSGGAGLRWWDGAAWTDHRSPTAPPARPAPVGAGGAPRSSGCVKALLIGLAVAAVVGVAAVVAVFLVGRRVVENLDDRVNGTPGRPESLPAGADDYEGQRREDRVAGEDGRVDLGAISVSATGWSPTTSAGGDALLCGQVTVRRRSPGDSAFDTATRIAGTFSWELVTPAGATVPHDEEASSLSALADHLVEGRAGEESGRVCFADPGESGQFAVTWQPRLLEAERAVWIFRLAS